MYVPIGERLVRVRVLEVVSWKNKSGGWRIKVKLLNMYILEGWQ